jgi:D-serine dehydratase
MREALNNPAGDVLVDATTKGIPSNSAPLRLSEIGSQGWNVLAGDCPLPLAVIRTDILAANSAWMMSFVRHHGLLLARTGCRDVESALAVANAIAAVPGLTLAGVEAFEGVLPDTAAVTAFMARITETTLAIDALGLFTRDIVLSAGGSAFFDLVALGFKAVTLSRPVLRVLRSGCYLTHDQFGYAHDLQRILRERRVSLPEGTLRPALEVWSYVQSRPDPDKAILTMGKRDVGYDNGWPQPVAWFRPGEMLAPAAIPAGCTITTLNDQHAHM